MEKFDKELPCNLGQKWTEQEEDILLDELHKNMNIHMIASNHNRSTGGIQSRIKVIAYKLHLKNDSTEEIIKKTKLDNITIKQIIEYKSKSQKDIPNKKSEISENSLSTPQNSIFKILQKEMCEIKNDIKELKIINKELIEIIKAYEMKKIDS